MRSQFLVLFWRDEGGKTIAEAVIKPVPRSLANYAPVTTRSWHQWCYLHRLWVAARHRGNGLGAELMQEVTDWADRSRTSLILRVNPFEPNGLSARQLHRFYRRHDFERVRTGVMARYA